MAKRILSIVLIGLGVVCGARAHAESGVTADAILLGQSAAFSGPGQRLGDAKSAAPQLKPSFNNIEGYICAKLFVEGLRRAGPNLTREQFIDALESFRDVDVGRFRVSFSPNSHNGSDFVGLTVIIGKQGSFMPIFKTESARR